MRDSDDHDGGQVPTLIDGSQRLPSARDVPPVGRGQDGSATFQVVSGVAMVVLSLPDLDIVGAFKTAIQWVLEFAIEGTLGALNSVFAVGIDGFLFFTNPASVAALETTWWRSVTLYILLMVVGTLGQLLVMQFQPRNERVRVSRWLKRILIGTMLILISRELIALAVAVTNALAGAFYRQPIDLRWSVTIMQRLLESGSLYMAVTIAVFTVPILMGLGLGLLFILVVRMYVVYMVYALFPLLIGFWLFDFGPAKYARSFAMSAFEITANLLLFGIFATAALTVGATLGGFASMPAEGSAFAAAGQPSFSGGSQGISVDTTQFTTALKQLVLLLSTICSVIVVGVISIVKGAL